MLAIMKRLVAAIVASTFVGTAGASPCATLELEAVHSLPIQQVGQLAIQKVEPGVRYMVGLWSFDSESHPVRKSFHAVGLLLVGMGDIDEQPVGAMVWSSQDADLAVVHLGNDQFKITVDRPGEACTPMSIEFRVSADGTVWAGKQRLGKYQ